MDGREFDTDDEVIFTDNSGKKQPGIIHGVQYIEGEWEEVGAHRPDMHGPPGPDNQPIPGTGHMEMVKGTEGKHHSFSYIVVQKDVHGKWWKINEAHETHQSLKAEGIKKYSDLPSHEAADKHFKAVGYKPPSLLNEPLPELKQFKREGHELQKVA